MEQVVLHDARTLMSWIRFMVSVEQWAGAFPDGGRESGSRWLGSVRGPVSVGWDQFVDQFPLVGISSWTRFMVSVEQWAGALRDAECAVLIPEISQVLYDQRPVVGNECFGALRGVEKSSRPKRETPRL
jgi:hypothetical protein